MRVGVIYESMFGNTRRIAEAVAKGIKGDGDVGDVTVMAVADADRGIAEWADLLVIGAPTHAHSMSRPNTRKGAADIAAKPNSRVTLEPHALGKGIREWVQSVEAFPAPVATFDTRIKAPRWLTGSAARALARALNRRGARVITDAVSFFVTKDNALRPGEEERAAEWGRALVAAALAGHRRATR